MNRKTYLAIAFGAWFGLAHSSAEGQTIRVDHRTYPADFASTRIGDDVEGKPGYTWNHDGQGWIMECRNPYYCTPPTPPPHVPAAPVFEVGQQIRQPYNSFEATVVAVTPDQGKTIVTARMTLNGGVVSNFYFVFDAENAIWWPIELNRHFLPGSGQ